MDLTALLPYYGNFSVSKWLASLSNELKKNPCAFINEIKSLGLRGMLEITMTNNIRDRLQILSFLETPPPFRYMIQSL